MLNPSQTRVVDVPLTQFARGFQQQGMVAKALFPEVFVDLPGGQVIEFDKQAFVLQDTLRTPGGSTRRVEFGYAGRPYATENHALEAPVPDEQERDTNIIPGIELGQEAVGIVMDGMLLRLEKQAADLATNASNYATSNRLDISAARWSTAGASPKTVVQNARAAIRAATGQYPNTLILPPNACGRLDMITEIRERLKYTSSSNVTTDLLARYFDVQTVLEGNAIFAASAASATFGDVWGNNAVLAYVAPASGGMMRSARRPSFGYTYTLRGHPYVKKPYRDENRESWVYGVHYERVPVIAGAGAGFLIQNVF